MKITNDLNINLKKGKNDNEFSSRFHSLAEELLNHVFKNEHDSVDSSLLDNLKAIRTILEKHSSSESTLSYELDSRLNESIFNEIINLTLERILERQERPGAKGRSLNFLKKFLSVNQFVYNESDNWQESGSKGKRKYLTSDSTMFTGASGSGKSYVMQRMYKLDMLKRKNSFLIRTGEFDSTFSINDALINIDTQIMRNIDLLRNEIKEMKNAQKSLSASEVIKMIRPNLYIDSLNGSLVSKSALIHVNICISFWIVKLIDEMSKLFEIAKQLDKDNVVTIFIEDTLIDLTKLFKNLSSGPLKSVVLFLTKKNKDSGAETSDTGANNVSKLFTYHYSHPEFRKEIVNTSAKMSAVLTNLMNERMDIEFHFREMLKESKLSGALLRNAIDRDVLENDFRLSNAFVNSRIPLNFIITMSSDDASEWKKFFCNSHIFPPRSLTLKNTEFRVDSLIRSNSMVPLFERFHRISSSFVSSVARDARAKDFLDEISSLIDDLRADLSELL